MESSYKPVELASASGAAIIKDVRRATDRIAPPVQWRLYQASLLALDAACIFLSFFLAQWVRLNVPLPFFNVGATPSIPSVMLVVLGFIPFWLVIFALMGLYQRRNLLGGLQEYSLVFRATGLGMLAIVIFGFLRPISTPARGWVALAWLFTMVFIILGRFLLRRGVYYLRGKGYFLTPALIIGANGEARSLAEQLLMWRRSGLDVAGFVSDEEAPGTLAYKNLPVLGGVDELEALAEQLQIEELVIATSALTQEQILAVFKGFGMRPDVTVRLSSGLFEVITTGLEVKEVASVPLVRVNQVRLNEQDRLLKTGLDLAMGLGLLVLFSPLFVVIPLAIRRDSPGPVFYRRRVLGLNGKPFDAFKFRTMVVNGDALLADHPDLQAELAETHKLKEDPRVTRIGQKLRKHSLDELPQLFNVLRREMSVVGPRMITPEEVAKYEQWDMNLLTVLPGITGLWQVSGRSDVDYGERVQLDMRYIRNWSIWLDLHILMRTIIAVLKGDGAY